MSGRRDSHPRPSPWPRKKFYSGSERVAGIGPASYPWEGHVLPLNHTRTSTFGLSVNFI